MQLGDLVGPLQDELPRYREIQKSGRKSTSVRSKPSATDASGSMGPPQTIPKKGKGTAIVVPMSEDEDGHPQGQPTEASMDVDGENDEEADVNESQGENDGEDEDEEEEEELVDQMAVEDEEIRRDIKGFDLHNQPADGDEDV